MIGNYEDPRKVFGKAVGDLAGPGLFAMFMGISRMLYGTKGAAPAKPGGGAG